MGVLHYRSYRRLVQGGVLAPGVRGFLRAVGREWGVESSWRVPVLAVGKGLRRMTRLAGAWPRKLR